MAQKYSNNDIPDLNADWGQDTKDEQQRPYSNGAVQTFIKKQLKSKVGYPFINGDVLEFFADEDSANKYYEDPDANADLLLRSISLEIGSTQYKVRLNNMMDSRNITTAKGTACNLLLQYTSQYKEFGEETWIENTDDFGLINVYVKNGEDSAYRQVINGLRVTEGSTFSIDVASYLKIGDNNVMLKATGENSERETVALTFSITLSTLSLTSQFDWQNIFFKESLYNIGGLYIGGRIKKNLFVVVSNDSWSKTYTTALGTTDYASNAYTFQGLEFPEPGEGVYHIKLWVESEDGNIKTDVFDYNIICIESDKTEGNVYIALNNIASNATNYATKQLLQFVCYNGTSPTLNYTIMWKGTAEGKEHVETFDSTANTQAITSFSPTVEIETEENDNFTLTATFVQTGGDGTTLAEQSFEVDNSAGYSAQAGATVYITPRNRNNSSADHTTLYNSITGEVVESTFENMLWGSTDGYLQDEEGTPILRFVGQQGVTLNYAPFANWKNGGAKTIEFMFNSEDNQDTRPLFFIGNSDCDGTTDTFTRGIFADNNQIIVYSKNKNTNLDDQCVWTSEEKKLHIAITLSPNIYGNKGTHFVSIYINGVKNREFAYDNNDDWALDLANTKFFIGACGGTLDFYGYREYDIALSAEGVKRNCVNWLATIAEKAAFTKRNDVLDNGEASLDMVSSKYNYFIVEVEDGSEPPSISQTNDVKSNIEFHFKDNPVWDVTLKHVKHRYQGTSSKNYYRWNWRFDGLKSDKDGVTEISYPNNPDAATDDKTWPKSGKKFKFGNTADHSEFISKLTAKKNFASSMHSHKMGSVEAYNDLWAACGLTNSVNGRVAVWQYPFVGFLKRTDDTGEVTYEFCGLYTIGPDKGNDPTFGYDKVEGEYASIEGSDNGPLMTKFQLPWDTNKGYISYEASEEAIIYKRLGTNVVCWDYDSGTTDSEDQDGTEDLLRRFWKDAYNFVYTTNTNIAWFDGGIDDLNKEENKGACYATGYEYMCNDYCLYYYEPNEAKFIPAVTDSSTGDVMNLEVQLKDIMSDADWFKKHTPDSDASGYGDLSFANFVEVAKAARLTLFYNHLGDYFNVDDAIFHLNFIEFFAASDNLAKNTYPYKLGESEKWQWRQDDLDTIFDITNIGLQNKPYNVELSDEGVFNGTTSVFWHNLMEAFAEEVAKGMVKLIEAMITLGGTASNDVLSCLQFFEKYYWGKAQEYFPENLYNADFKWTYEAAHFALNYSWQSTALAQGLGDHYAAERAWVTKRIVYMMSKYTCGIFSDTPTNDSITFRYAAEETVTYSLTPAMDMYPSILTGTSIAKGSRTSAGETANIEVQGAIDQDIRIQGASYLQSIGDFHTMAIGNSEHSTGKMGFTVSAKRLQELILGSQDDKDNIRVNIPSLTVNNCKALRKLIISNLSSLSGTLTVSDSPLLEELLADGTSISVINLPDGGNLKHIFYGAKTSTLIMKNLRMIENIEFENECPLIGQILLEGMDKDNTGATTNSEKLNTTMDLMMRIYYGTGYNSETKTNDVVKYVRLTGINSIVPTASSDNAIDMLYNLTQGGFHSMKSDGTVDDENIPVIEGSIYFEEMFEAYAEECKKYFPNLTITGNPGKPSKDRIGLTLVSPAATTVTEDSDDVKAGVPTEVKASNPLLQGVQYTIAKNTLGVTIDKDSGAMNTNEVFPLKDNLNSSNTLTVNGVSKWNATAQVQRRITITGTKMTTITLTSNATDMPKKGDVLEIYASKDDKTTKPLSHIDFKVTQEDLATVEKTSDGVAKVTIISDSVGAELDVIAYNAYDDAVKDTIIWHINDTIIIDTENDLVTATIIDHLDTDESSSVKLTGTTSYQINENTVIQGHVVFPVNNLTNGGSYSCVFGAPSKFWIAMSNWGGRHWRYCSPVEAPSGMATFGDSFSPNQDLQFSMNFSTGEFYTNGTLSRTFIEDDLAAIRGQYLTINACITPYWYYIQCYENGSVVREFLPCKLSNGQYGIIDTTTKEFIWMGERGEDSVADPVVYEIPNPNSLVLQNWLYENNVSFNNKHTYQSDVSTLTNSNFRNFCNNNLDYLPWKKMYDFSTFQYFKGVTYIGNDLQTFRTCSLTSLILPDTCTTLGVGSLYYARHLKYLKGYGIKYLNSDASTEGSALEEVHLKNKEQFKNMYCGNPLLRNQKGHIYFDEDGTMLDEYENLSQFIKDDAITDLRFMNVPFISVTLPDSLTSIGSSAFQSCSSLASVTLPDSLTSIGSNAFSGCSKLETINCSDETLKLLLGATNGLRECSSLKLDHLPEGLTAVGTNCCYLDKSMTITELPNSLLHLYDGAFQSCTGCSISKLPDGLLTLGAYCLGGWTCLDKNMKLPDSITKINGFLLGTDGWDSGNNIWHWNGHLPKNLTGTLGSPSRYVYNTTGRAYGKITTVNQWAHQHSWPNLLAFFFDEGEAESLTFNDLGLSWGGVTGEIKTIDLPSRTISANSREFTYTSYQNVIVRATTPFSLHLAGNASAITNIFVPLSAVDTYKAASTWSNWIDTTYAIGSSQWCEEYDIAYDSTYDDGTIAYDDLPNAVKFADYDYHKEFRPAGYYDDTVPDCDGKMLDSKGNVITVDLDAFVWPEVGKLEFVDLGLPSGLLWANRNIGAERITDAGLRFQWGGTTGHDVTENYNFSSSNYPESTLPSDITEDSGYDAARVNLGSPWRLPTKAEFEELINNTTFTWTSIKGINGAKFTSKTDDTKYIFFPAVGFYNATSPQYSGSNGYYWSSSYDDGSSAYYLTFGSQSCGVSHDIGRSCGYPIRGVATAASTDSTTTE